MNEITDEEIKLAKEKFENVKKIFEHVCKEQARVNDYVEKIQQLLNDTEEKYKKWLK